MDWSWAALEAEQRTAMIVLKGGWQRLGATGRMGETAARAAGLNPSCTLELQHPDAQATPETNSIRISGDGSQASIFLKTLSRCQRTAEAEKMRRWRAGLLKLSCSYELSGDVVKVQILACRSGLG